MSGIEPLVILPVAAFHLAVVPGSKGPDDLVTNAVGLQMLLEQRRSLLMACEPVGKFRTVIRLDAFDGAGEGFDQMFHELSRRIGAVFLERFHETPARAFVNGGVLEELLPDDLTVLQTGRGDKFHIHLEPLSRIGHLLIGLGDILRIGRMHRHDALFSKDPVKAGDRAGVAALSELDPENDQAGMRIPAAHIADQLEFLRGMLIGVGMGTSGEVTERVPGAVITAFPTVDVLPVGFIFDSGIGDTKFFSIFNEG